MVMGIPLPPFPGAGGYATAAYNALTEAALKNKQDEAQRLANEYNTKMNPLAIQKQQQENEFNAQANPLKIQAAQQTNAFNEKMSPFKLQEAEIKSRYAEEEKQTEIEKGKAQAQYYSGGGPGMGAGGAEKVQLRNFIAQDNQNFTPRQVYEATNKALEGQSQLDDGTPINIGGQAQSTLNQVKLRDTTAAAYNSAVNSAQAKAEEDVMVKLADKWIKPYGTTYFNRSPQQIMDTFKNDNESQDRLGDFIAGQALQFEISRFRDSIARGTPSITALKELENMSKQIIKAEYPKLSARARERASKQISYAINEAYKERLKIGINPSGLQQFSGNVLGNEGSTQQSNEKGRMKYNPQTGMLE